MFDIEENERRELRALMARDELPTPDAATRAALLAASVDLGPSGHTAPFTRATLPPLWRKEQGAQHRLFFLVDEEGRRRFRVWWKAALPFAAEPGYGGIAEEQRRDDYARSWSADDSFEVQAMGRRRLMIGCQRCCKRVCVELSAMVEHDDPRARERCEEMAERYFAREHPTCPEERRVEVERMLLGPWEPWL